MKEKTYLITGIMGFAAPHLAKTLLKDGHKIHGLARGGEERERDLLNVLNSEEIAAIEFHYGDLRDKEYVSGVFENNEFDGVFHLGAQTNMGMARKEPQKTFEINANGTVNIVESVMKHQTDCKLMLCSSGAVYGKVSGDITEETPMNPIEPYGVSKAAAELYVKERALTSKLPFFIARALSHTGRRRGKNFTISWDAWHLAMLKNGKNPNGDITPMDKSDMPDDIMKALPVGNLSAERIVMDARDCVEAYKMLMDNYDESMRGEAYNVCGKKDESFKLEKYTDDLIKISGLEGIVKVKDKRVFRPIEGDPQKIIVDTTKIREKIGWEPKIPIGETLKDLFDYWLAETA